MKNLLLTAIWVAALAVAYAYGRLEGQSSGRPSFTPHSTAKKANGKKANDENAIEASLSRDNLQQLWRQVSLREELRGDLALREAILRAWARENPGDALALAASFPSPQRDEAKEIVLESWLVHDFVSALGWINANDRAFLLSERFVSAATQAGEFQQAALALRGVPKSGNKEQWLFAQRFEALASAWSNRDMKAAFAWLSALPADERKLATLGYVSAWAKNAPREAADWAIKCSVHSQDVRDAVYCTVQSWVGTGDIANAAAWIEEQHSDKRLDTSRSELAEEYARRNDVESAGRLLRQISDPSDKSYSADMASYYISKQSPANAVRIAEEIPNPALRSKRVQKYIERWWEKANAVPS